MNYRQKHPRGPGKASKGLLVDGEQKELMSIATGDIFYEEAYTISRAADALGRTRMTINKWISEGVLPAPCLTLHTGNRVMYARKELQTIADVVRDHEKEFDSICQSHTVTIHRIWQRVEAVRRSEGYLGIGEDND